MDNFDKACDLLRRQLGKNVVIALGTMAGDMPSVRNVNAYYKDGYLYILTTEDSYKMRHIHSNANVGFCRGYGEGVPFPEALLEGFGRGESLGHPLADENSLLRAELKIVFSDFYDEDVDEDNKETCILRIALTLVVLFDFDNALKYIADFGARKAECVGLNG